ncbi:hypothetical protein [Salinibaculum rarum]|uniref:hypothetical protein n=1 Tax=Salinibaculum rarum TaxID=3058903 RepID=UPI00265FE165|nr:hypothetical protein [Salinibaculum sp. KK48]
MYPYVIQSVIEYVGIRRTLAVVGVVEFVLVATGVELSNFVTGCLMLLGMIDPLSRWAAIVERVVPVLVSDEYSGASANN